MSTGDLYDAIKDLAIAHGARADAARIELYCRGMEDLDPEEARDTAEQARRHFERFPSIKHLRGYHALRMSEKNADRSGQGFFPLSRAKRHGTPPWTYTVPPSGAFARVSRGLEGGEVEEWFEGDIGGGQMRKVGEKVRDDLGFWLFVPQGKVPSEHPRWNKGVPKWEGRSVAELVKALQKRLGEIVTRC
jgi:hypothetical protein